MADPPTAGIGLPLCTRNSLKSSVESNVQSSDEKRAPQHMTADPAVGSAQRTTGRFGRDRPVLLVGSNGGHLAQLVPLRAWLSDRSRAWVTFRKEDALSH